MRVKDSFARIVQSFAHKRVLVVGDIMLDEYIWGQVQRISPEAPVPIVHIERRTYGAGGAANVAANVVSLGGHALLCGVVGKDLGADMLRFALRERGVDIGGLIVDPERPTTTKTRIIAHGQQIVRMDAESHAALRVQLEDMIVKWVQIHLHDVDVCILSDYEKGVVSPRLARSIICLAQRAGKPVIVDPKGTAYAKYDGATVITPNTHEAARAANLDATSETNLGEISQRLMTLLPNTALLITRGPQGMSLFVTGTDEVHIATMARNVFDVTGAGDTVVSTMSLCMAVGTSLEDAAHIANVAAGIVVGKAGTSTVTFDELLNANVPAGSDIHCEVLLA